MNKFKVVLLGDTMCGKTSVVNRYSENIFNENMESITGTRFTAVTRGNTKLFIWDVSGHIKYKSVVKIYFKDVNAVIFVFDIISEESLNNIDNWYSEYFNSSDYKNDIPLFLVGNKVDLLKNNLLDSKINEISEKYNMKIFKTSAKKNIGIETLFSDVSKTIFKLKNQNIAEIDDTILLVNNKNNKEKKCCAI